MWRKIISIITGIVVFFVLVGLVFWIFARFRIGPVGNMITVMFAFRDTGYEGTEEYIEYSASLREALAFMHYVVLPILSVLTGFLTAKISKTYGWLCAMIAVGVPVIATLPLSKHMFFILPIILCISLAAATGYITNKFGTRTRSV